MREKPVVANVLLKHGARNNLRIWRQSSGLAWTSNKIEICETATTIRVLPGDVVIRHAHPIRFGFPGISDIIGIRRVIVTPDQVGTTMGQFVAIECKSDTGRPSEPQRNFLNMIRDFGGIGVLARSPEDVDI